jgi:hypothetical protein
MTRTIADADLSPAALALFSCSSLPAYVERAEQHAARLRVRTVLTAEEIAAGIDRCARGLAESEERTLDEIELSLLIAVGGWQPDSAVRKATLSVASSKAPSLLWPSGLARKLARYATGVVQTGAGTLVFPPKQAPTRAGTAETTWRSAQAGTTVGAAAILLHQVRVNSRASPAQTHMVHRSAP